MLKLGLFVMKLVTFSKKLLRHFSKVDSIGFQPAPLRCVPSLVVFTVSEWSAAVPLGGGSSKY